MLNILFPTDFTELSLNAFHYALEYAIKTSAKLTIYHTFDESDTTPEAQSIYDKVDIQNFRNKQDSFPPFEKIISDRNIENLKVRYIVKEGKFIEAIKKYVAKREEKIDLIIMGTHGKTKSLFDIFMENNTIRILEQISKPVIAVPQRAVYDGSIDNIAFLVDYREDEKDALLEIAEQAEQLNARLHVIHFDLAHGDSIVPRMDIFKESLQLANHHKVSFNSIDSLDLKKSLLKYCDEHNIDMVCVINHARNYYQRLFSYSLAEELINHVDTPVMAIYRE